MRKTYDLHVVETRPLINPALLHYDLPLSPTTAALVAQTRDRIRDILQGRDRRLLIVVGPCSVHDVQAAYDYGERLAALRQELADDLEIVMRVYFEKPRTNIGWKGLINDPHLDGSYDLNQGVRMARRLLLDLASLGVPAATELLDPVIPQYIADVIAWTAIGARTTESQTHREMASGLSMPIGFKNSTDGTLQAAINAMLAARQPQHFLGINRHGLASIIATTGNLDTHLVLRGGSTGMNYDASSVSAAAKDLRALNLTSRIMVDCSHANSQGDYKRQAQVLEAVTDQLRLGSVDLLGLMIESNLVAGKQSLPKDLSQLVYGQSVTDACIDFETTAALLRQLAKAKKQITGVVI